VITGDLVSGSGLREAVASVSAIINCASAPQGANQVDVEGTRSLLQAAHESRAHIVYPSIVRLLDTLTSAGRVQTRFYKLIRRVTTVTE
jgi:nucleoside-diphosphate-sugar epimerase